MSNFLHTFRAVDHLIVAGACLAALAWLAANAWARREVDRHVDHALAVDDDGMTPHLDDERLAHIEQHARRAFEAQMANRPHIAAMRARQEAEAFDPDAVDWTEVSGR